MREKLFYILRKYTSADTRSALKNRLLKVRNNFSFLFRIRYGSFNTADLKREIMSKISNDYEILMVHSSFDHLKPMYNGTPYGLLKMLLEITEGRTLAMPAFTFGGSSNEIYNYFKRKPYFDKNKTPTIVGLVNELFRRYPNVKRSLHPTLSVCAYGPLAEILTATHHTADTNLGESTPFGIMNSRKTIILGLGVYYFRNLTHVHTAEDILKKDFPFKGSTEFETIKIKLLDGERKYDYDIKLNLDTTNSVSRNLALLEKILSKDELYQWKFKGVPLFYAKARRVTEALIESTKKGITIYNFSK
jgi:aminoglycoside N3'-acetyltransferase